VGQTRIDPHSRGRTVRPGEALVARTRCAAGHGAKVLGLCVNNQFDPKQSEQLDMVMEKELCVPSTKSPRLAAAVAIEPVDAAGSARRSWEDILLNLIGRVYPVDHGQIAIGGRISSLMPATHVAVYIPLQVDGPTSSFRRAEPPHQSQGDPKTPVCHRALLVSCPLTTEI
jgi:hypothetical protein